MISSSLNKLQPDAAWWQQKYGNGFPYIIIDNASMGPRRVSRGNSLSLTPWTRTAAPRVREQPVFYTRQRGLCPAPNHILLPFFSRKSHIASAPRSLFITEPLAAKMSKKPSHDETGRIDIDVRQTDRRDFALTSLLSRPEADK